MVHPVPFIWQRKSCIQECWLIVVLWTKCRKGQRGKPPVIIFKHQNIDISYLWQSSAQRFLRYMLVYHYINHFMGNTAIKLVSRGISGLWRKKIANFIMDIMYIANFLCSVGFDWWEFNGAMMFCWGPKHKEGIFNNLWLLYMQFWTSLHHTRGIQAAKNIYRTTLSIISGK